MDCESRDCQPPVDHRAKVTLDRVAEERLPRVALDLQEGLQDVNVRISLKHPQARCSWEHEGAATVLHLDDAFQEACAHVVEPRLSGAVLLVEVAAKSESGPVVVKRSAAWCADGTLGEWDLPTDQLRHRSCPTPYVEFEEVL